MGLPSRTWGSLTSLWTGHPRRVPWLYREPSWVLVLDVVLLLALRWGAAKLPAMLLIRWQERRRRRDGGKGVAGGAAEGRVAFIKGMVAAAEAPVAVCLTASVLSHVLALAVEAVQATGRVPAAAAAQAVTKVWVAQLLNYTSTGCWLALRLLEARLELSGVRPSLSGDLSNLATASPHTSREYAQEAARMQILRVAILAVAALICLTHVGVDVSRILYVISVSGVALSLLLGDILSNLLGGSVLYLTQPFARGDWVQTPSERIDGEVQSIGLYYTGLITREKRPCYVPNARLAFGPIVNCSRMTHRRILIKGPLRMQDLNRVEEILADIRNLVENHNDIDKSMHRIARLSNIKESWVQMRVSCYTRAIRLDLFLDVQQSILLGMTAILRKYGTTWASAAERYLPPPRSSPNGDARLEAEFRRLLTARSSLRTRERDLDAREEKLAELRKRHEASLESVRFIRQDLGAQMARAAQQAALIEARRASLLQREGALRVKHEAASYRHEAVQHLDESIRLLAAKAPEEADRLYQDALEMRRVSVHVAYEAVVLERTAVESEREALEREKELLESKRRQGLKQAAAVG